MDPNSKPVVLHEICPGTKEKLVRRPTKKHCNRFDGSHTEFLCIRNNTEDFGFCGLLF
jgi:hypothetical protein